MADWRSLGSSSPWSNYQSMGPDDDVDAEGEIDGHNREQETIRPQHHIELYNPLQFGLLQQPRAQQFASHTPSRPGGPDARLHIDDLRESPMLRNDLISLEFNPRAPITEDQPQAQPQPRPQSHRQSQSSTDAVGGSFLNQLVAGIWQPKRAASEPQIDEELQVHYAQQQTPPAHHQQQQRLSNTRTFEDMLPRRSLLVPSPTEYDIGRHTLDPEELLRQPRVTSPSMRNLQQFRPVAMPPGAVPPPSSTSGGTVPRSTGVEGGHNRPTTRQDGERSRGVSTATSSLRGDSNAASRATAVERAHRIFATKQVRFEDSWHTDMWIYMKNAHPFIGIFGAHHWHPYKRRDRIVVLLVALLAMFLCCGVFATQKCCDVVLDTPIAVVDRRLTSSAAVLSSTAATYQQCAAFYGSCDSNTDDELPSLCTEGSTCSSISGQTGKQCVPLVAAAARSCGGEGALTCPTGWTCDAATHKCAPSSSRVCYLPRTMSSSAVSFAAEGSNGNSESGGLTAIEAIFGILIIANGNSTATSNSSTSGSSSVDTTPAPAQKATQTTQSISVALTKPTDGGVYSVASSVPIEWTVSALSGGEQPLKAFSVEFSADGTTFATIATDITASSSSSSGTESTNSGATSASVFHYDWKLNNNAALLCTKCVLRVCSTVGSESSSSATKSNSVCIRSDGGETATDSSSSSFVVTKTSIAARKGITFRIVREILECSCGLSHASFVQFSYLIALVLPLAVLLLEQLVTFYQDSKLHGLFTRRGGPVTPRLCFYGRNGADRVGRVLLVIVLAAACVGVGIQLAQVNEANFYNQKGKIVLLWLAMYALCVLIGFIYCSLLFLALFSLRWKLEFAQKNHVGPRNDFQRPTPLLDPNNFQQHQRAPLSELVEEDEDESRRSAAMLGAL